MEDITGKRFGRLVVKEFVGRNKKYQSIYLCLCDCGNMREVKGFRLKNGETKSCGCLHKEVTSTINYKHGNCKKEKRTSEYQVWNQMIQRCHNINNKRFPHYGGRGIKVCDRWRYSFENFLEDMGKKPGKEYSIDRTDNNGNYEPGNCRWATQKEQCKNTRKNVWLECDGIKMIKVDWQRELGVSNVFIDKRLKKNIPFSEVVRQAKEYVFNKGI